MNEKQRWVLTFTRPGGAGSEIGRFGSRDLSMLAAQAHFDQHARSPNRNDEDELGWQMSFSSATALTRIGTYRVRLS